MVLDERRVGDRVDDGLSLQAAAVVVDTLAEPYDVAAQPRPRSPD
jgi:hypothetical protein